MPVRREAMHSRQAISKPDSQRCESFQNFAVLSSSSFLLKSRHIKSARGSKAYHEIAKVSLLQRNLTLFFGTGWGDGMRQRLGAERLCPRHE